MPAVRPSHTPHTQRNDVPHLSMKLLRKTAATCGPAMMQSVAASARAQTATEPNTPTMTANGKSTNLMHPPWANDYGPFPESPSLLYHKNLKVNTPKKRMGSGCRTIRRTRAQRRSLPAEEGGRSAVERDHQSDGHQSDHKKNDYTDLETLIERVPIFPKLA